MELCVELHAAVGNCECFNVYSKSLIKSLTSSPVPPQNTKVTIMDQEITTISSPTALHPRRLSLQPSPLTSWALDQEPWRDQATTLQTTKGSRT